MKVLVSGGAGFVGSHYVRTMLSGGYPGFEDAYVTVLDKLTYAGNLASLQPVVGSPRFTFVGGDICDEAVLSSVVPGHDAVINFAADTRPAVPAGAPGLVLVNVGGVQALLQACVNSQVQRVVQVSTEAVYGNVESGLLPPGAPADAASLYAASRAGGDLMALAYARSEGLDVSVTRGSATYGPYQHPEQDIPLMITRLLAGRPVPLHGDGGQERRWLHVDDHCRAIQLVLEQGAAGCVYHISGDTDLTECDLVKAVLELCGMGWDMVERVAEVPGHDRRRALDDAVLAGLGFAPRTPFALGLESTVRWYEENRSWWELLLRRSRQAAARAAGGWRDRQLLSPAARRCAGSRSASCGAPGPGRPGAGAPWPPSGPASPGARQPA